MYKLYYAKDYKQNKYWSSPLKYKKSKSIWLANNQKPQDKTMSLKKRKKCELLFLFLTEQQIVCTRASQQ